MKYSHRAHHQLAFDAMPLWTTRFVVALTCLAWALTIWAVLSTRGVVQAFLTIFVLPIEEGLQFIRAVATGNWILLAILGGHFIVVATYAIIWHRRQRGRHNNQEAPT